MDILLYITELLQSRKTIGIVGLGTLYKKKSPGKYDVEKHAFVPPIYALAFTTELKEQDELANFISEKRNITVESANYYISEFVDKIHAQLADHNEADLEPIGKLKLVNGEIDLIADQESSFGFEFYGLPTIKELPLEESENINSSSDIEVKEDSSEEIVIPAAPIAAADAIEEIAEENKLAEENPGQETPSDTLQTELAPDEQPVFDEIAEVPSTPLVNETVVNEFKTTEKPSPIVPNTYTPNYDFDDDEKPNRTGKIWLKVLIVLIIIALGSAIVYFFFPELLDRKIENAPDNKPLTTIPVAPIDSTILNLDSINLADSLAKSKNTVNVPKETPKVDSAKTIVYEVIGSAERNQKRIDYVISYMKKRGIDAKALKNVPGKLIKISLGSFTNYDLAKEYQDSLRVKLKNPQIYIQSIKPTH